VDTSAPPAYIDPKCLVASDGFVVVDNKLVLGNFQLFTPPVALPAGVRLLGFGNYYDAMVGTVNYILGYTEHLLLARRVG